MYTAEGLFLLLQVSIRITLPWWSVWILASHQPGKLWKSLSQSYTDAWNSGTISTSYKQEEHSVVLGVCLIWVEPISRWHGILLCKAWCMDLDIFHVWLVLTHTMKLIRKYADISGHLLFTTTEKIFGIVRTFVQKWRRRPASTKSRCQAYDRLSAVMYKKSMNLSGVFRCLHKVFHCCKKPLVSAVLAPNLERKRT